MGTGIGIDCQRCGCQLNYDDGFNYNRTLCNSCDSIVRFDIKTVEEKKEILDRDSYIY